METPLTKNFRADGDAVRFDDYAHAGGYQGLRKAFTLAPADITTLVKTSNLRGRGGAGFPTGMKWSFVPMGRMRRVRSTWFATPTKWSPALLKIGL